jgi:hypothetical protein
MASVETTIVSVLDIFPVLKKKASYKALTVITICVINFLLGIVYTLQSGTYWYDFSLNKIIIFEILLNHFLNLRIGK